MTNSMISAFLFRVLPSTGGAEDQNQRFKRCFILCSLQIPRAIISLAGFENIR